MYELEQKDVDKIVDEIAAKVSKNNIENISNQQMLEIMKQSIYESIVEFTNCTMKGLSHSLKTM
jgi:hypothetical protein